MEIPTTTYRIQLSPSFGFGAAKEILPYLADLGASHIYASPILKARRGSPHGYDLVDPSRLNEELGGGEGLQDLLQLVRHHQMGWIQDLVPNHMAYDHENEMLMDLLEQGQSSRFFHFFDVEWDHPSETLRGRILAPFLGKLYNASLEEAEIQLVYEEGDLTAGYYNLRFPLKLASYHQVFTHQLDSLESRLGPDHPDLMRFLGTVNLLTSLESAAPQPERHSQVTFVKRMLWELYTGSPEIREFIDRNIRTFNGERTRPESFDLLDRLLSDQMFRLSFWKVTTEETNYRRFFAINSLISMRVEDEEVFNHTHDLTLRLIGEGSFAGMRIDHIDGLYDPAKYLAKLREKCPELYMVVEKILGWGEDLPSSWPVQGTTGYDFLNHLNGIFCERQHEEIFNRIYGKFSGLDHSYEELLSSKKRLITGTHMAGEIDNLAHLLKRISGRYRYGRDITLYGLKRALVEIMACFPVYRTYISGAASERDTAYVKESAEKAAEKMPGLSYELQLIGRILLLQFHEQIPEEEKQEWLHFVRRFQQFTGPLMAKGLEDTLMYVYNRLLSLNEVGGSPNHFGISLEDFHAFNRKRKELWPHAMNATSTHDTKRGEDVRARLNVLSEIPGEWERRLAHWSLINREKKKKLKGQTVPDGNDEYFLYQTLVGAFPFDDEERSLFLPRMQRYIIKAVREAKVHTAWLKPDEEYEEAFVSFLDAILTPSRENRFLKSFLPFQRKVAYYGIFNSLSQTLLKITSPGVPDLYQGADLWDLSLVDPDNRRPVDFKKRAQYLQEIREKEKENLPGLIEELLACREDGRIKIFLLYRALQARREMRHLFEEGEYCSLETGGKFSEHIVAFVRKCGDSWGITIAPRFFTSLVREGEYPLGPDLWKDTHLLLPENSPLQWKDALTEEDFKGKGTLLLGEVLRHFPVAFLRNRL